MMQDRKYKTKHGAKRTVEEMTELIRKTQNWVNEVKYHTRSVCDQGILEDMSFLLRKQILKL